MGNKSWGYGYLEGEIDDLVIHSLCPRTHPFWRWGGCRVGLVCHVAGECGCAHPVEPGWCGRCPSRGLCPRAAIRRTGRHRRASPIRLHTRAEHDPPQSYLCHAAGGTRLPCPEMVRPPKRSTTPPEATRVVTASYPAGVRAWIRKRGGLTQKLIYLREGAFGLYPRC